jgi:hypothetical protein
MENYKSKYIKYKNKYLELKNKLVGSVGDIYHVNCIYSKENEQIFLSLLLQLLVEYSTMFEIIKKNKQNPFSALNNHLTSNYNQTINNEESSSDNNFLSILKFLNYTDQSINTLLNTKEQIDDTIKIISDYCNGDIICRIKLYKKELLNNLLDLVCVEKINDDKNNEMIYSFYDSRNYSISVMLNILLGKYNDLNQPPILIYKLNQIGLIEGHVFILYHHEIASLEAISIQTSLKLLLDNLCDNVKAGLSVKLFNYVINQIVPIFKSANYLYAYAWKIMSDILVAKFNFNTIEKKNFGGYLIDGIDVNYNIEELYVNSYNYRLIRDLKDKATNQNDLYIFTVKKIC